MRQDESGAQHNQTSSLMRRGEVDGDQIDEGADAESGLEGDGMEEAGGALSSAAWEEGRDSLGASVDEESEDGAEGGDGKDTVVHLDGARVLEHVAPPEIGVVFLAGVELVEELLLGREQANTHLGEFVVDETSIQTGDETTRHGSNKGKTSNSPDKASEGLDVTVSNALGDLEGGRGILQPLVSAQDSETRDEHPGVADKGGRKMSGKSILRNSRVRAGSKEIILETRLDHPPADDALEADQAGDAEEVDGHLGGDLAAGDKVQRREDKGHADEASPETVEPFHKVNLLEFVEGHVRVEEGELGGGAILFELGVPFFLVRGKH